MQAPPPRQGRLLVAVAMGSNEAPASRSPFDLDPPADARARALEGALVLMRARGWELVAASPLYDTSPEGDDSALAAFLNACVLLDVPDDLHALLEGCEAIEREAGRKTKGDGAARPLDLDIIVAWRASGGDRLAPLEPLTSGRLTLPHPRMEGRAFVLVPLVGVAPDAPVALPSGERGLTPWTLLRRLARSASGAVRPGPPSASFPSRHATCPAAGRDG